MGSSEVYWRALPEAARQRRAERLAGGWLWLREVERLDRAGGREVVPLSEVPGDVSERLVAPRSAVAAVNMDAPRIMAILNVTPDSFSDGGADAGAGEAVARGLALAGEGADFLDVGGESTRPGAQVVPVKEELARVLPVIGGLARATDVPVSVDTRKAAVAAAALEAGAALVNDVSAMTFDEGMAGQVAASGAPVCLMHAGGDPETMQDDPRYDDVLLDVYDALAARVALAEAAGIDRGRIVVDPGIGFGKTRAHNLALLRGLSLFHALGCPVLLGASRKGFIGRIGGAEAPAARMPGSLAVFLHGISQGVQISRVHDMAASKQALALAMALRGAADA